ncbi:MAG: carbonic anhydrase family protein [Sulfuritalea sp.]|nr:carbonic anhydrase family protein [Sulfuritalea sp.]
MSVLPASAAIGVFVLIIGLQGTAVAGGWQKVAAGKNETIEMDMLSVSRSAASATAWSRIRLDRNVSDASGSYDSIRALIQYDCAGRRFTTLRRAYFNSDTPLRDEEVSRQRANRVEVGSVDERLLSLACVAVTKGGLPAEAGIGAEAEVKILLQQEAERPAAMHADMRTLANSQPTPKLTPVADTTPVVAAGKPKMIILPAIDKAAADRAAMDMTDAGGKVAGKSKAEAPISSPKAAPERAQAPLAAPIREPGAPPPAENAADKRLRELHYATSGPPRRAKKKAPETQTNVPDAVTVPKAVKWSYEGEGGPANWAQLRSDYATCGNGQRQSPIDIREGIKVNLEDIKFDYKPTQFRITDTGHTVEVHVGHGMGLTVMGKRYELQQFHFHRPSEERVNGRAYDMVVHLVHRNDEGQLAVVAILLENGSEHPLIQTLWNNLPLERETDVTPDDVIDLNKLLPEGRTYWTYMGSLTTPPCSEGVLWMVMKQAVQISPEQVSIFSHVYRNNARPVQAANARLIKGSR